MPNREIFPDILQVEFKHRFVAFLGWISCPHTSNIFKLSRNDQYIACRMHREYGTSAWSRPPIFDTGERNTRHLSCSALFRPCLARRNQPPKQMLWSPHFDSMLGDDWCVCCCANLADILLQCPSNHRIYCAGCFERLVEDARRARRELKCGKCMRGLKLGFTR